MKTLKGIVSRDGQWRLIYDSRRQKGRPCEITFHQYTTVLHLQLEGTEISSKSIFRKALAMASQQDQDEAKPPTKLQVTIAYPGHQVAPAHQPRILRIHTGERVYLLRGPRLVGCRSKVPTVTGAWRDVAAVMGCVKSEKILINEGGGRQSP